MSIIVLVPVICLVIALIADPKIDLFLSPQVGVFAAIWFVLAYGEEIGWRGFLLPNLAKKYSPFLGSTIVGFLWCIWHYPKMISNRYIEDWDQVAVWIGSFSIQIIFANYIISWLYFKTRSIFVTSLFHALFNTMATIYYTMAIDANVTATLSGVALILIFFDRKVFFQKILP